MSEKEQKRSKEWNNYNKNKNYEWGKGAEKKRRSETINEMK